MSKRGGGGGGGEQSLALIILLTSWKIGLEFNENITQLLTVYMQHLWYW